MHMSKKTYKILATERGMQMYQDGKFVCDGAAGIDNKWAILIRNILIQIIVGQISSGVEITIVEIDQKNNEFDN